MKKLKVDSCNIYISNEGFIFITYKEFLQIYNKEADNLLEKWTKDLNSHFIKENIQMTIEHRKSASTLLITIEMLIKVTMWYHYTTTRNAKIKRCLVSRAGEDIKQLEFSDTAPGNVN